MNSLEAPSALSPTVSRSYWDRLPEEMSLEVCTWLGPMDSVRSFSPVCRRFYTLSRDQSLWKHFCQALGLPREVNQNEEIDFYHVYRSFVELTKRNVKEMCYTEMHLPSHDNSCFAGNAIALVQGNVLTLFNPSTHEKTEDFLLADEHSLELLKQFKIKWDSFKLQMNNLLENKTFNPKECDLESLLDQAQSLNYVSLVCCIKELMPVQLNIGALYKKISKIDLLIKKYQHFLTQPKKNFMLCEISQNYLAVTYGALLCIFDRGSKACLWVFYAFYGAGVYAHDQHSLFSTNDPIQGSLLRMITRLAYNCYKSPRNIPYDNHFDLGYDLDEIFFYPDIERNKVSSTKLPYPVLAACINPARNRLAVVTWIDHGYYLQIYLIDSSLKIDLSTGLSIHLKTIICTTSLQTRSSPPDTNFYFLEWQHNYIWITDSDGYYRMHIPDYLDVAHALALEKLFTYPTEHRFRQFRWMGNMLIKLGKPNSDESLTIYDFSLQSPAWPITTHTPAEEEICSEPVRKKIRREHK